MAADHVARLPAAEIGRNIAATASASPAWSKSQKNFEIMCCYQVHH
jgi:hypothetical protein